VRKTKAKKAVSKINKRIKHFVRPLNSQVKNDQDYNVFTAFLHKINISMDKKTRHSNKFKAHSKAKKVALRSVSSTLSLKLKVKKEQKQAIEYLLSANPSWPFDNEVFSTNTNTNSQLPCFEIDRNILCGQKQNSRCKNCANNFYNKFVILKQHYEPDSIMTIQNCEEGCIYGGSPLYFVLHYFYDGTQEGLVVVPVSRKGTFAGKYMGHPRFRAVILDTNVNWIVVPAQDCHTITVVRVAKTTRVSTEAWTIPTEIKTHTSDVDAVNESPLLAIVDNEINSDDKPLLTKYGRKRCEQSDDDDNDITLRVMHHEASGRPIQSSKSSTTVTVSRRSNRTSRAPINADGTIAQSYSANTTVAARHSTSSSSTHTPAVIRSSRRSTKAPVNADGTIAQSNSASIAVAARRSTDSNSTHAHAVTRPSRRSTNVPVNADGTKVQGYSVSTAIATRRPTGSINTHLPGVTRCSKRITKAPVNADGTKVQSYS
jgi:hypothetical protein